LVKLSGVFNVSRKKTPATLAELASSKAVVAKFRQEMDKHFAAEDTSCGGGGDCCYCELQGLIEKAVELIDGLDLPDLQQAAARRKH